MDNVQISSSMALLLMDTMVERGYRKQSRRRFWQPRRIPEWTSKTMTATLCKHRLKAAEGKNESQEWSREVDGDREMSRERGGEKAHSS